MKKELSSYKCIILCYIYKVDNYFSGGPESAEMQKVNVTLSSNEDCRAFYRRVGRLNYGINDKIMLCAGDLGRDSCQVTMP